jgi:hypothetical protein
MFATFVTAALGLLPGLRLFLLTASFGFPPLFPFPPIDIAWAVHVLVVIHPIPDGLRPEIFTDLVEHPSVEPQNVYRCPACARLDHSAAGRLALAGGPLDMTRVYH